MSFKVTYIEVTDNGGRTLSYEGEVAHRVYNGINKAGAIGAEWTMPIELENGNHRVFVLKNITSFLFKEGE